MTAPVEIHGRTIHNKQARTTVTVLDQYGDTYAVIHGGTLQERNREFTLTAKHPTATDEEHDSAYAAYFNGVGLAFDHMTGGSITLTGAILDAAFHDDVQDRDEDCPICPDPHPVISFTPPARAWRPGLYTLRVTFNAGAR